MGKRLVEKGEETVNSVVNGKMKKHTKKKLDHLHSLSGS